MSILGDCSVAMANMVLHGEYALPDGSMAAGICCVLVPVNPAGEKVWVGMGSIATIHGMHWEVVAIKKVSGENGSIVVKQLADI